MVDVALFKHFPYLVLGFLAANVADGAAPVSHRHSGDDIVELLQGSFHVNQKAEHVATDEHKSSAGEANGIVLEAEFVATQEQSSLTESYSPTGGHSWKQLEDMVLSRVRDSTKLAGKGNGLFVKKIGSMISRMQASINTSKTSNQQMITNAIDRFGRCTSKMRDSQKGSKKKLKKFSVLKNVHKECEESYVDIVDSQKSHLLKLENAQAELQDIKDQWKDEKAKQTAKICGSTEFENYQQQLTRMLHRFKKELKKMEGLAATRKEKRIKVAALKAVVYRRKQMIKAMAKKCQIISNQMDDAACGSVTILKNACRTHGSCWENTLKEYKRLSKSVKKEEKDMKIEWRALGRINCFLGVLSPGKKEKKKKATLEDCIKTPVSADHLSIDYGKIPKKPKCPKIPKRCPCKPMYLKEQYGLKGMISKCKRCPACK